MRLHCSHRTEDLADALARILETPAPGAAVLAPERVVVQSPGMARWLSMRLARRTGICAHMAFEFPAKVLASLTSPVGSIGSTATTSGEAFRRDVLRWRILSRLPELLPLPAFAPLRRDAGAFATNGVADARALSLADRLADLADRYLTWRPDMVLAWEDAPDAAADSDDWQRLLWRSVLASMPAEERGHLARRSLAPAWNGAGGRLCFFGMPTLPPLYMDVLQALDAKGLGAEIHLFVPVPVRVWAGDAATPGQRLRARLRGGSAADHLAEGHPLIHSLGGLAVQFQAALAERGLLDVEEDVPEGGGLGAAPGTLLAQIQEDIVLHQVPTPLERTAEAWAADRSVAFRACHSLLRQVETLRDDLLGLLAADPSLSPRDMVVLTPDIDTLAPLVEAVFGDPEARPALRFQIADRSLQAESPWAAALLGLLRLAGGRLPASEVLDLLSLPPLQARYGLEGEVLAEVTRLVTASGIRWGRDAAHRAREGQPADPHNTWRFGLDRLLLGVASPDAVGPPFGGVLPLPGLEGSGVESLSCLVAAWRGLEAALDALERPGTPAEWCERLTAVLTDWAQDDEEAALTAATARQAVLDTFEQAKTGDFAGQLSLEAARALMERVLGGADEQARGFLSGGVTVCALMPMRSIPFRVLCMVGMDDGAFPRNPPRPAFDRMAQTPRPGDRTPRDDDRSLFLEALLACRGSLRVYFTGNDIRTNGPRPPAVVVEELFDVFRQMGAPESLLSRHPLQPFSPRRFQTPGLPCYDARAHAGALALCGPRVVAPPFVTRPLSAAPRKGRRQTIALSELRRFFEGPGRWFLTRRLGVELGEGAQDTPDREPFMLDALACYGVRESLLSGLAAGGAPDDVRERPRLEGRLPLGTPGEALLATEWQRVQSVATLAESVRHGEALAPVEVRHTVEIDGTRYDVEGAVDALFPGGRVAARAAKTGGKPLVGAWIAHVFWQLATRRPNTTHVIGYGADGVEHVELGPAEAPEALARRMVELYLAGQRAPLRLFPKTSMAFAQVLHEAAQKGEAPDLGKAWKAAAETWDGGFNRDPEGQDAALRRLFGDVPVDALDTCLPGALPAEGETFAALAVDFFGPLLAHVVGGTP